MTANLIRFDGIAEDDDFNFEATLDRDQCQSLYYLLHAYLDNHRGLRKDAEIVDTLRDLLNQFGAYGQNDGIRIVGSVYQGDVMVDLYAPDTKLVNSYFYPASRR